MSQPNLVPSRSLVRRAAVAGLLGTLIESYDFAVYAYLVVYTAPLFFPSGTQGTAVLSSLLVFAAGFVARPLGGLFFGRMGDRIGRRRTLVLTVTLMGIATFAMGILPTHDVIGLAAPLLLVLARLVQGFSAGGELMGSATFVAEYAPARRRGLFNAMTPLGFSIGVALAPAVVGLATLLTSGHMASWGWRIPFLVSLPLTIACLVYRMKIEDSPEFKALVARQEVPSSPVLEVLRDHWRAVLRVAALSLTVGLVGYTTSAYLPIYLQTEAGLPKGTVSLVAAIALFLALPFSLVSGFAVDRFGRRAVLVTVLVVITVAVFPGMFLMGGAGTTVFVVGAVFWLLVGLAGAAPPPAYAAFTGFFPTRVRYTGAAIGFNLGSILGAGFAPYAAARLTAATGNPYAPALLIAAAAVLGVVVILTAPATDAAGTAPAPLRATDEGAREGAR
ncbi:MFS transporter [Amycolatopsis thermoflava]|uniref:MFS transporter n=1 Tax=Amycolatopsis thermoflava TaxID=84480 RepID=UPI0037F7EA49